MAARWTAWLLIPVLVGAKPLHGTAFASLPPAATALSRRQHSSAVLRPSISETSQPSVAPLRRAQATRAYMTGPRPHRWAWFLLGAGAATCAAAAALAARGFFRRASSKSAALMGPSVSPREELVARIALFPFISREPYNSSADPSASPSPSAAIEVHKASGVLAFVWEGDEPWFLMQRQADKKGRVCLTDLGGKVELSDNGDSAVTAAREFLEELSGEEPPKPGQTEIVTQALKWLWPRFKFYSKNSLYTLYLLKLEKRPPFVPGGEWISRTDLVRAIRNKELHIRLRKLPNLRETVEELRADTQGEGF